VITIDRDTYGVPHIYGATETDTAFGFGYAQAQDHLDTLLRNYLEASGHLAEIDGETALEADVCIRLWKPDTRATAVYRNLIPSTRAYVEAFVGGVNAYMDAHPDRLPFYAEHVTPQQVIAFIRLLHIRLTEWRMPELRSPALSGMSNQWVVAPRKTDQGVTLCVMDPHVPWTPVFRMYEAHLVSEDGLNIYGGAPFGLPVIIMGHTGRHAWSLTVNGCDIGDMYAEQIDPAHPNRYRNGNEWLDMETWQETFRIRTEEGFREETRTLSRTHHGPVIAVAGDRAFSVRISADDIDDPLTVMLHMARAQNLEAFKTALDPLGLPLFNIVYGDTDGQIYYVYNERCPVRSATFDWSKPVPGWQHTAEWQTYYPFRMLPQIENPQAGFLQNCNNSPWYVTPDSPIRPQDWPSYLVSEEQNDRSRRVFDRLSRNDRITVEETIALVMDEYCLTADRHWSALMTACERLLREPTGLEDHSAKAIKLLREWDRVGNVHSTAMTLFTLWKIRCDARFEAHEGEPDQGTRGQIETEALDETIQDMVARHGRVEVAWGDIHRLCRGDRTYPVGGSSRHTEAIRPVGGKLDDEGRIVADSGSAFTMVVALGDKTEAWSLVPYGNSERSDSPHFADQIPLWTQGRLKRTRFTSEEVAAHRVSREKLMRS